MEHDHVPDPTEGGLSTEDLVQPRDATTDESQVPTFPGESTAEARPAETAQSQETATPSEEEAPHLLTQHDEDDFRARWQEIQSKFVDDPRDAVHTADTLVAEVMQTLAKTFAEQKQELEGQWNRGEQADTENLRVALRHYRAFFNRLLTT